MIDNELNVLGVSGEIKINENLQNECKKRETAIAFMANTSFRTEVSEIVEVNVLEGQDLVIPLDDIQVRQENCPDLSRLIKYLKNGDLPEDDKLARRTCFEGNNYFLQEGVLYHISKRKASRISNVIYPTVEQIVVPQDMRVELMGKYHSMGHKNSDRTYHSIMDKFFWPTIYTDTKEFVRSCNWCQKVNPANHPKKVPLKPWEVDQI